MDGTAQILAVENIQKYVLSWFLLYNFEYITYDNLWKKMYVPFF